MEFAYGLPMVCRWFAYGCRITPWRIPGWPAGRLRWVAALLTMPKRLVGQAAPRRAPLLALLPRGSPQGAPRVPCRLLTLLTLVVRESAQAAPSAATLLTLLARGSAPAVSRAGSVFAPLARGSAEGVPGAATMRPPP